MKRENCRRTLLLAWRTRVSKDGITDWDTAARGRQAKAALEVGVGPGVALPLRYAAGTGWLRAWRVKHSPRVQLSREESSWPRRAPGEPRQDVGGQL